MERLRNGGIMKAGSGEGGMGVWGGGEAAKTERREAKREEERG